MAILSIAWKDADPYTWILMWGCDSATMIWIFLWFWTDPCCRIHVNGALLLPPHPLPPPPLSRLADGRRADVRCRARGGRGCAAVSADHCQLITVQPTQALALREPLHGPHQRGRCSSTCSPFCLPPQHTQHLHTEHISSQDGRRRQNVNKAKKKGNMNKWKWFIFIYMEIFFFCVCTYIGTPPKEGSHLEPALWISALITHAETKAQYYLNFW